jgi:hypothetical protein
MRAWQLQLPLADSSCDSCWSATLSSLPLRCRRCCRTNSEAGSWKRCQLLNSVGWLCSSSLGLLRLHRLLGCLQQQRPGHADLASCPYRTHIAPHSVNVALPVHGAATLNYLKQPLVHVVLWMSLCQLCRSSLHQGAAQKGRHHRRCRDDVASSVIHSTCGLLELCDMGWLRHLSW